MKWAANYALAIELSRDFINLVLDKFIQSLKAQQQHSYSKKLGLFGNFQAELSQLFIPELEDPAPVGGGVFTDLDLMGKFTFQLFGFINLNSDVQFLLRDVLIDFTATQAGAPDTVVIASTPTTQIQVSFPNASFLIRWFLNGIIAPAVSFGAWLVFRLLQKVEFKLWNLVSHFAKLGLSFSPNSPLLTAQKQVSPHSLLLASSFNLSSPLIGQPDQLKSFLPSQANIGAVVHQAIANVGVQLAFTKGWVPRNFKVKGFRIHINSIAVRFKRDTIEAYGSMKAKKGSCWCRVKARITFRAGVKPRVDISPAGQPSAVFEYDVDINTRISTSGMLVVMGAILLAPLFMSLTILMSSLINVLLSKFLPFNCQFQINGGYLDVDVRSVNFAGFIPFHMRFALQLSGEGNYSLTPFQQFVLPGNVPLNVGYSTETISVQEEELRAAVHLS